MGYCSGLLSARALSWAERVFKPDNPSCAINSEWRIDHAGSADHCPDTEAQPHMMRESFIEPWQRSIKQQAIGGLLNQRESIMLQYPSGFSDLFDIQATQRPSAVQQ